jgi:hypothetical protein
MTALKQICCYKFAYLTVRVTAAVHRGFSRQLLPKNNQLLLPSGTGQTSAPIHCLATLRRPVIRIGRPSQAFPPKEPYVKVSLHTAQAFMTNYCPRCISCLIFSCFCLWQVTCNSSRLLRLSLPPKDRGFLWCNCNISVSSKGI